MDQPRTRRAGVGRVLLLGLHALIIINFVAQIAYAAYMVFVVVVPEGGGGGPLLGRAAEMPHELMVTRRLYAIEFWIATVGLSVYLAITEIGPRLRQQRTAAGGAP